MANDAGKITIKFDADMTAINKKLNDLATDIGIISDTAGSVSGGGSVAGSSRRQRSSTFAGGPNIESVSSAPTMGAFAEAAAAGLTTPVGVSTTAGIRSELNEARYAGPYGGMAGRYRTPRASMSRPPSAFGQALSNVVSPQGLLGLYFTAAFGGMELQASSNAIFGGLADAGNATTEAQSIRALSAMQQAPLQGPVGSVIANIDTMMGGRMGIAFAGSRANINANASEALARGTRANIASSLAAGQVAGQMAGGTRGQMMIAEASARATMSNAAEDLRQKNLALKALEGAPAPTMAALYAAQGAVIGAGGLGAAGAAVGAIGGLAGGPAGAVAGGVYGGAKAAAIGASLGAGLGYLIGAGGDPERIRQRQQNIDIARQEMNGMRDRLRSLGAVERDRMEIIRQDLGRQEASQLRGLGVAGMGANAVAPSAIFDAEMAGINSDYADVSGERGVTYEANSAARRLRDERAAAARRKRDSTVRSFGYARRGMAGRYAAFMGDTIGGGRQASYESAMGLRDDLISSGMDAGAAGQMAGQQFEMDFGGIQRDYASTRLSNQAGIAFDRVINGGGTPFTAQRASLALQAASARAKTRDAGMLSDINEAMRGQMGQIARNEFNFNQEVAGNFQAREAVLDNRGNPYANSVIGFAAGAASRIRGFNFAGQGDAAVREAQISRRELNRMFDPYQGSQVGNPLAYAGADGAMADRAKAAGERLISDAESSKDLKKLAEVAQAVLAILTNGVTP
jgi:hypothetical protein